MVWNSRLVGRVKESSRLNPSILNMGVASLESIQVTAANDMGERFSLWNHSSISSLKQTDVVIAVSDLRVGGVTKYVSQLLKKFVEQDKTVTIFVTNSYRSTRLEKNFRDQAGDSNQVLYWQSISKDPEDYSSMNYLMRLVRAETFVAVNCEAGYKLVSFGLVSELFERDRIFVFFFSANQKYFSGNLISIYGKILIDTSTLVTDNYAAKNELGDSLPISQRNRILVLPNYIQSRNPNLVELQKNDLGQLPLKWLWVSRVEPMKGIETLCHIAKLRPKESFDVFGPLEMEFPKEFNSLHNLNYFGEKNIGLIPTQEYKALIFTSLFEGQPNTVLEFLQRGLPVLSTDVGDLERLFKSKEITLVPVVDDAHKMAQLFSQMMDRFLALSFSEKREYTEQAWVRTQKNHSESAYVSSFRLIFGP